MVYMRTWHIVGYQMSNTGLRVASQSGSKKVKRRKIPLIVKKMRDQHMSQMILFNDHEEVARILFFIFYFSTPLRKLMGCVSNQYGS